MTWQFVIILQILLSSLMTLYMRRISLSIEKVFFGVAVVSYLVVAGMGWIFAGIMTESLSLPSRDVWVFILIQAACIPSAWLIQYRLIKYIGASNMVIVTTLNTLLAATFGIVLLRESIDWAFVVGSVLIISGVWMVLRLRADTDHKIEVALSTKLLLALCGALLFAIGIVAEKSAVNAIGAWDYMGFGWSMQAVGALVLFALFGRNERHHVSRQAVSRAAILGFLTSIAGMLFVYALSLGSLSQTIVATSGKAVVVMAFAAIFLHERNAMATRVLAFTLTMMGLGLVLG